MRRNEVIARLNEAAPTIKARGVAHLYLYGSHARDTAAVDSDVDVFVERTPGQRFGFDEFMDVYLKLRDTLGVEIDYSTREGLIEFYRPEIEREAIRIF